MIKCLCRASFQFSFTGLLLLLPCLAAPAQSLNWRWSNPTPHGGNIHDQAVGWDMVFQVAERGQVYTSDDLELWTPRRTGTTNALRAATFLGERLVVTGESGTVVYADSLDDFRRVDLGTTDWLEGVAASESRVVAVGDNGAVYTSTDGVNWARRQVTFTTWLRSVAYSPVTRSFVAVGERGLIASSNNGESWTIRSSGTTKDLNKVSWIGTRFWAVGEEGTVLTSSVGQVTGWSRTSFPSTNSLYSVVEDAVATRLVLGDMEVRFREGTSWSDETAASKSFPAPKWTYYSGSWLGELYFVAGRSGMMVEGFRTNSTSPWFWVSRSEPIRSWLWDMARAPGFYVAVGDRATIMTSSDGADWELELPPASVTTNSVLLGVASSTNLVVAVGAKGTILVSPDVPYVTVTTNGSGVTVTNTSSTMGIVWHAVTPPITNDLQGITYSGGFWVAAGSGGAVIRSHDGTNWTGATFRGTNYLSGVCAYPGGYVAVGRGGTLLTSVDATSWTPRATGTTNWLYRVRHFDGVLVVVGENGTILTSTDGVIWTPRPSGTSRWLTDVAKVGDRFYICGHQGTFLSSADLASWLYEGTLTEKSLFALASSNGQLLTAGVEGAILRTRAVPITNTVSFVGYGRKGTNNIYLLAGETDQRFTLDKSTDLKTWTKGAEYEFLDSSGTLLLVEEVPTNAPPIQFYRTTLIP